MCCFTCNPQRTFEANVKLLGAAGQCINTPASGDLAQTQWFTGNGEACTGRNASNVNL